MVARLTSISSSNRIRHQEVAGSSPAVVGYLRVDSIFFLQLYTSISTGLEMGERESHSSSLHVFFCSSHANLATFCSDVLETVTFQIYSP
jgi:hypothetical protein